MIEVTRSDILKADAEALVNTVNCVGVMDRCIAAQFKRAYPKNFSVYQQACKRHEGVVGVEGERATDVADRGGAQGWLGVAGRRARGDERLVRGVGGRGDRLAAAGEAAIAVEVGIDRRGEVGGGGRTRGGIAAGRTP
jgi:hypothetical protein